MEKMVKKGEFVPMSNRDILFEERSANDIDTYFMDTTVMDALTIQGYLPDAKDSMLRVINRLLS